MIFTHDHLDHYDPETASHFLKRNEKRITVLSPSSVWQKVRAEASGHNCVEFNSGSEWTEGHLRFTAVPAEHSDRWSIGVLIEELTEHKTYYVTGDTLYHAKIFPAIPASVDVVFLPVNGVGNNMNLTDAARFANRIGAKTVVPIHFGMFDKLSPCGMEVANCIIPTPYQEISIYKYKNSEEKEMKLYEVKDHAPSILPDGYEFELAWADEFDGNELDTEKWDYRFCMMGKRHPAWSDECVEVRDGCAVFSVREENGEVVSSQLQTGYNYMDEPIKATTFGKDVLQWPIGKLRKSKYTHRYGYYECRCRLQQKKGWWSAFWLQSPIIGASLDPKLTGSEVDIMESFLPGQVKPHNVFTGGYGQDMQRRFVGGKEVDPKEFHTFGLLWLPDKYVFFIDGVEDGVVEENVSAIEQFILISTEVKGYRKENHRPTDEAYELAKTGDEFLVDHVRIFNIKE